MEKEIKITALDGCEIEKVELVDGVAVVTFREKKWKLPKSWEDLCEMTGIKIPYNLDQRLLEVFGDRATAEAVLALCQLIQLRNAFNDGWVPGKGDKYYCIVLTLNDIDTYETKGMPEILFFKTEELRDEFLRCFKSLIEKLKPLYGIKEGGEE